eukprot:1674443-Amphidinium_carterae.1
MVGSNGSSVQTINRATGVGELCPKPEGLWWDWRLRRSYSRAGHGVRKGLTKTEHPIRGPPRHSKRTLSTRYHLPEWVWSLIADAGGRG